MTDEIELAPYTVSFTVSDHSNDTNSATWKSATWKMKTEADVTCKICEDVTGDFEKIVCDECQIIVMQIKNNMQKEVLDKMYDELKDLCE